MKGFIKRFLATVLTVVMLLTVAPLNGFVDLFDFSIEASAAEKTYKVNGVTIPIGKYVNNGPCYLDANGNGNCWAFAQYVYKKLWPADKTFTSYRGTSDDMLRKIPTGDARKITAENAKKYISFAQPGATIRIADYIDGSDGYNGGKAKKIHSVILVSKDNNGCVIYDSNVTINGKKVTRLRYYTWEQFATSFKANKYFKYIKWPSAPAFSDNITVTLTSDKKDVTNTSGKIKADFNSSFSVQGTYYILSTNKADINVDATKENNRKKTSTRDFTTVKGAHTAKSIEADVLTYKGAKLQPKKTYYYKVLVKASGKWYQSGVGSFTTKNELPAAPELTFATGKTDYAKSDSVAVTWKSVKNADSYNITVYNSDFDVVYGENGITSNSFSLAPNSECLTSAGDYYISIAAVNAVGKTEAAGKKKFTVHEDKTVEFYDTISKQVIKTETVPYGHAATAPKMSAVTGYTFIKWDVDFTNVTENIRINTVYEPHEYTVTFVDDKNVLVKKEVVKYSQSVKDVPEAPPKTGYVFSAWSVKSGEGNSYTSVNGNVTFEPTYVWENPTIPLAVEVTKALRTSNLQGYTVYSSVTNGTDKEISGKLIAVIKTSNDKVVATKMDVVTIPANVEGYEIVTNIGGTSVGTTAEVYIVANDKENDNKTGGAYSEKAYVKVTRETTSENKYWGEWSQWSTVKPDAKNDREIESKTQYRYRDKKFTTVTNSTTKTGWTLVSSTPSSYTSWGSWSSWSTTKQTETTLKDVETRTVYKYQHYCDGTGAKAYISPTKSTTHKYGPHTIYSTTKWTNDRKSSVKDSNGNYYNICDGHTKCEKGSGSYYYMGTATQYRYRTRQPIYSFWQWSAWSSWSDTVCTSSTNRGVETQVLYRYRDLHTSSEIVSEDYIGEENLTGTSYTIQGNLSNIQENYSGKVATIMVYKEKNTDPTETQIEYVGQTVIGENNSYNFKFIPREEISLSTGDYIVSFGIATADGLVNYVDVIEAPKPEYTVWFYDFDGETVLEKVVVKEGETAIASDETLGKLTIPEGHRFTNWNQSTVNVRSDLAVMPLSEVQKFAVVFIDWESQNVILEEYEYGDEIVPPDATPREGFDVSWDMSMAQKVDSTETVEENGEDGTNADANEEKYIVVQHTVVSTVYTSVNYNSTFVSPDSDIAKIENGLIIEGSNVGVDGDNSEIVINEEDIISVEANTFDEYIDTPIEVEEAEEYIFRGWKNVMTGEYLTDMHPQNDAIYVPMFEFAETAEAPEADLVTGEYTEAQTVTLTSATESAVIYYTLDGTDPQTSETAIMYTAPITISSSTVLKFCAMAVNMNNSDTVMELYAINTDDVVPYHIVSVYTDLPYEEGFAYQSLVKDFVRFDATPLQNVTGYTYSGLYYDEDFTEEFDTQNEPVIESMDVYAHYVPLQYKVTFLNDDGTKLDEQLVNYGEAAVEPEVPVKEGYVFVGWDSDGYECVTEEGVYTARYIPESEYAYVTIKGRATRPAYTGGDIKLTAVITPDELSNEPVSWTSSDSSVATVDYMGNVSCVGIGTAYVTVTVDSNGESYSVKLVVNEDNTAKVVLGPQSYLVVDSLNYIRGLKVAVNTVEEVRSHFTNDVIYFYDKDGKELSATEKVGTDTVVKLIDGEEVLDERIFIMTGDVNGDGWYDAQDSTIVSCLASGLLTSDQVSEAVYIAADCNYDGIINQIDVDLLNKAGALLSNIDQTQSVEELQTDAAYIEYVELIDQTADIEIEVEDKNENDSDTEVKDDVVDDDVTDNEQSSSKMSLIDFIIAVIKSFFEMLLSLFA